MPPIASSSGSDHPHSERHLDRLAILVVEDDQNVRNLIKDQLENSGHEVQTAADGKEGLDRFLSGKWDVVLTDRAMPEMNGDELAAAIKETAPDMPIILVTGFADRPPDLSRGDSPFAMIIRKPFTRGTLAAAVTAVCGRKV